jgi:hypothetical protein
VPTIDSGASCRCGSKRFVYETESGALSCIDCNWGDVLSGGPGDIDRCVAVSSYGGTSNKRCSNRSDVNNLCHRHARWRALDLLTYEPNRLRFSGSVEERLYLDVIAHARRDADLFAEEESRATRYEEIRRMTALAKKVMHTTMSAPPGHCVYFLRLGKYIKIGTTGNIIKRIGDISTGRSCIMPPDDAPELWQMELMATTPGSTFMESSLHGRFAKDRVVGEWFISTPELLKLIFRYQRKADSRSIAD